MNPFGYNLNSRCKNKRFSNRPVTRNSDTFGYEERSEVIFSRRDAESVEYSYDEIGNLVACSSASITNQYVANNLNQYATILRASATPREINPQCDLDGNLLSDGVYAFVYDSQNRCIFSPLEKEEWEICCEEQNQTLNLNSAVVSIKSPFDAIKLGASPWFCVSPNG